MLASSESLLLVVVQFENQLVKIYGAERPGEARYSPAKIIGIKSEEVCGTPEPRQVSNSFVERSNLTIRMMNRRFTRLTNAFSKKIENHMHPFALFVMHYNCCKLHKAIRVPCTLLIWWDFRRSMWETS
jgi:hypothetical protein